MDNENLSSLRILQWNINGIRSKLQDIILLCEREKIDVVLLQETKVTPRCHVRIPGFNLFRNDRTDRGGGVLIGVKSSILSTRINILDSDETECELVGAKIIWQEMSFCLFSIYVPNTTQIRTNDLNRIMSTEGSDILVGGDFNAHAELWGSHITNSRGRSVQGWIEDNGLVVLNDGRPTRIACPPNASGAIDITLTTSNNSLLWNWTLFDEPLGSDHVPIIVTFRNPRMRSENEEPLYESPIRDARTDWDKYRQIVKRSLSNSLHEHSTHIQKLEQLVKIMWNSAVSAQKVVNSGNVTSYRDKVWFDAECVTLWEERREKFRHFRSTGTREAFLAYKRVDARAKNIFRKKRIDCWRQRCEGFSSSTSLSELWNMARSFRGESKRQGAPMDSHILGEFADKLASSYVSKAFHNEVEDSNFSTGWHNFSKQELLMALKDIKNRAGGEDRITASLLKNLPTEALSLILNVFNGFLDTTLIPESWLVSKIIAIRKQNKDGTHPEHFRPISLLSIVRKLFERMILSRLESWANECNLIPKSQMGFRRGVGTQNCLSKLHLQIQVAWAKKKMVGCVFLDVKSAYDNVLIDILCRDLVTWGLPLKVAILLSRLLTERRLKFYYNKMLREVRTGYRGLPQGSVLSPLCYNLYVRELELVIPESCFVLQYADDIAIGIVHADPEVIQTTLSTVCTEIQTFLENRGLALSIPKSAFMLFTRKHNPPNIQIECDRTVVQRVVSFKYLGVVFDVKCLWAAHIRHVITSCSKRSNFLRAVCGQKWGAHPTVLRILYITTIRSVLEYGCIVFSTAAKGHLLKLYRVQWRCLRVCLGLMRSTHTLTVEVLSGICPLELRFNLIIERFLVRSAIRQPDLWIDIDQLRTAGNNYSLARPVLALHEMGWSFGQDVENSREPSPEEMNMEISFIVWEQLKGFPKDLWSTTAAGLVRSLLSQERHLESRVIYTDGSKCNQGVGAGIWDASSNSQRCLPLNFNSSNYTAEVMAIKLALESVIDEPSNHCEICLMSDSMSAILSIKNYSGTQEKWHVLCEISRLCERLRHQGKLVFLAWVPSHVGVTGNDKADEAARRGAYSTDSSEGIMRTEDWFTVVRWECLMQWRWAWQVDDMGRYCYSILPNCNMQVWYKGMGDLNRECITTISRLLSNHNRLRAHMCRINVVEDPLCPVCHTYEDIDHVLFGCNRFVNEREQLINSCSSICPNLSVRDILGLCLEFKRNEPLKMIARFVKINNVSV